MFRFFTALAIGVFSGVYLIMYHEANGVDLNNQDVKNFQGGVICGSTIIWFILLPYIPNIRTVYNMYLRLNLLMVLMVHHNALAANHSMIGAFTRWYNAVVMVASQLNGMCGEWTASDDVKAKDSTARKTQVKSDKAKKKEAAKQAHQMNLEQAEALNPDQEYIKLEYLVPYISSRTNLPTYGLGAKMELVSRVMLSQELGGDRGFAMIGQSGRVYHNMVRAGEIVAARELSAGFYEEDDEEEIHLSCPFVDVVVSDNSTGHLRKKSLQVCTPCLRLLQAKFPGAKVNQNTLQGFGAALMKDFPQIPPHFRADTVVLFVEHLRANRELALRDHSLVNQLNLIEAKKLPHEREYIATTSECNIDAFIQYGIDPRYSGVVNELAVANPTENHTDNMMFEIKSSVGYNARAGHSIAGEFVTTKPQGEVRWYRSMFCCFVGSNPLSRFCVYDNSSRNATRALARLYKARGDEESLLRQYQLLATKISVDPVVDGCISNTSMATLDAQAMHALATLTPTEKVVMKRINERIRERYEAGGIGWITRITSLLNTFGRLCLIAWYWTSAKVIRGMAYGLLSIEWRRYAFAAAAKKRRLYESYLNQLYEYHTDSDHPQPDPQLNVKYETGKVAKLSRLFVSYGPAIVFGGWVYDDLKNIICRCWVDEEESIPFTHSCKKKLDCEVWECDDVGFHGRSYSDDAELIINIAGRPKLRLTVDIDSCDTSNGPGNFRIHGHMMWLLGMVTIFVGFMKQLKACITLRNPDNTAEKLVIKPRTMFMGSGDGSTTHANNIYMSNNFIAMHAMLVEANSQRPLHHSTDAEIVELCHRGARLNGCTLTIKIMACKQESDFLKTFQYDQLNGECGVALSYGAIFRNFGYVKGDLDAIKLGISSSVFKTLSEADRMEMFLSGIVAGLVNEPGSIIMDALRDRFHSTTRPISERYWETTFRGSQYIPTEQLMLRYGGSLGDWQHLADSIAGVTLGSVVACDILSRIYLHDYGLPP